MSTAPKSPTRKPNAALMKPAQPDDALVPVHNGKKHVTMFEMTKLVSGHVK